MRDRPRIRAFCNGVCCSFEGYAITLFERAAGYAEDGGRNQTKADLVSYAATLDDEGGEGNCPFRN